MIITCILIIIFCAIIILSIRNDLKRNRFDVFEVKNWILATFAFFFVVKPILFLLDNNAAIRIVSRYYIGDERVYFLALSIFCALISISAFLMGYNVRLCRSIALKIPCFSGKWDRRLCNLTIIFCGLLSLLSLWIYFNIYYDTNIEMVGGAGRRLLSKYGFISAFSDVLLILSFGLWMLGKKSNKKIKKLIAVIMLLAVFLGLRMGRTPIIQFLFIGIVIYHYSYKFLSVKKIAFLMLCLFIFGSGFLFLRSSHFFKSVDSVFEMFTYEQLISTQGLMLVLDEVPENIDYQYGKTFLHSLYVFAPRIIFPSKPDVPSVGGWFAQKTFPHLRAGGFGITLPGELYLNFGMIGIIFGMFIYGMSCKIFYIFFKLNQNNRSAVLLYSFTLFWIITLSYKYFYLFFAQYLKFVLLYIIAMAVITNFSLYKVKKNI